MLVYGMCNICGEKLLVYLKNDSKRILTFCSYKHLILRFETDWNSDGYYTHWINMSR